jgi:hypothetical protein
MVTGAYVLTPSSRMVAEAAAGKSKHYQMQMDARAAAKAKLKEQMARGEKATLPTSLPCN